MFTRLAGLALAAPRRLAGAGLLALIVFAVHPGPGADRARHRARRLPGGRRAGGSIAVQRPGQPGGGRDPCRPGRGQCHRPAGGGRLAAGLPRLAADFRRDPAVLLGGDAVAARQAGQQATRDLGLAEAITFPMLALLSLLIFRGVAALLPLAVGTVTLRRLHQRLPISETPSQPRIPAPAARS